MAKGRRQFSAAEKVRILREHLVEKATVSDVCDKYGLSPNVFYRWQKEFFENGSVVFERRNSGAARKQAVRISAMEAKLAKKDSVIAEIMASHVELKKNLGED